MTEYEFRREGGPLCAARTPAKRKPYVHRCSREVFEAVARWVLETGEPFTGEQIVETLETPSSATFVALRFLHEYGLVEGCYPRSNRLTPGTKWEDVMVPFEALEVGITGFEELCAVCNTRVRVAGVYCADCLGRETEGVSSEDLAAASDLMDRIQGEPMPETEVDAVLSENPWQLYSSEPGCEEANKALDEACLAGIKAGFASLADRFPALKRLHAARNALHYLSTVMDRYVALGATDSEPRWEAASRVGEAFGVDPNELY